MDLPKMNVIKTACFGLLLSLSALTYAGTVNINVANANDIAKAIHGVGINKATLVVEYRKAHGPFSAIEDIALVKGIGPKTIELNRDVIVIE